MRKNYEIFIGAAISAAKASIPIGFRKEYITCWNEVTDQLYKQFLESGDTEIGDKLLHSLDAARQAKWMKPLNSWTSQDRAEKQGLCCEGWTVKVKGCVRAIVSHQPLLQLILSKYLGLQKIFVL